jgi:hypothetical protein
MVVTCSGCWTVGVEGLYCLPRQSEEYVQLESLIAQRIREGGEYAAPIGGSHRQSVQLQDLDGDGVSEAIAFLADSSHTPTVCIYRQDGQGNYYLYVIISGEGSAVSSVEYADITGDGCNEFIIRWQISGDIQLLSAYSLGGEEPVETVLSADCSEFTLCDLDGDGVSELINLRLDTVGAGTLVRYVPGEDGKLVSTSAPLSAGIGQVLRMRSGYLSDGTSALFVESRWGEDSLVTDVFTAGTDGISNITVASAGRSNTVREGLAYATDINGDRVMEIPESTGDILNWYSLDSAGRKSLAVTTVHDYEDGWYLTLPESFGTAVTVEREDTVSGETAVTLYQGQEKLAVIYVLTGENRLDRASAGERFVLKQTDTTVYAAQLFTQDVTEEEFLHDFNLIYAEWQTGAL